MNYFVPIVDKKEIGEDDEDEYQFFHSIQFTNAFVLKINQLVKQVRISLLDNGPNYIVGCLIQKSEEISF